MPLVEISLRDVISAWLRQEKLALFYIRDMSATNLITVNFSLITCTNWRSPSCRVSMPVGIYDAHIVLYEDDGVIPDVLRPEDPQFFDKLRRHLNSATK